MHAERDWLVNRVLPSLRERMVRYRIHWIEIDLRWCVTNEQAENEQALDACRPFFIGLLGERSGWVTKKLPKRV